jgi:hypothetical protein
MFAHPGQGGLDILYLPRIGGRLAEVEPVVDVEHHEAG